MFVIYLLDSFHDNYNMPDSFYERFRLTGPELNRPGMVALRREMPRSSLGMTIGGMTIGA
jgi:hypothetical protein